MKKTAVLFPGQGIQGIRFIRLNFTKGIIAKVFNKFGIYGRYKKVSLREVADKGFVITACMFHNNTGFTVNGLNAFQPQLSAYSPNSLYLAQRRQFEPVSKTVIANACVSFNRRSHRYDSFNCLRIHKIIVLEIFDRGW